MSGPSFLIKNKIKNQVGLSAIVLVHPDRLTVRKILTYNMMLMTLMAVISIAVYAHVFSYIAGCQYIQIVGMRFSLQEWRFFSFLTVFFPHFLLKAISGYVIIFSGIQRCPLFCGRG